MNISKRTSAAAIMVALFLMGAVAGGVVVGLLWRDSVNPPVRGERVADRFEHPGPIRGPRSVLPERYLHRLDRELDLSATQEDSVRAILDRQRQEAAATMQEMGPVLRAGMDSALTHIRRVLHEDQQARFDEIMEQERQLMRRRWSPDREN